MYSSQANKAQKIWELLESDYSFRKSLVHQCFNTLLILDDEFGKFKCEQEKQLHIVLNGLTKPRWQSSEDFEALKAVPVFTWPLHVSEHLYDPKLVSLEKSTDVEVNGQFSKDLDLFYKAEDAEQLFDINIEKYKTICNLVIDALTIKSTDEKKYNELSEQITASNVFNYLSEEKAARDSLYYVCVFSHCGDETGRNILHDHRD